MNRSASLEESLIREVFFQELPDAHSWKYCCNPQLTHRSSLLDIHVQSGIEAYWVPWSWDPLHYEYHSSHSLNNRRSHANQCEAWWCWLPDWEPYVKLRLSQALVFVFDPFPFRTILKQPPSLAINTKHHQYSPQTHTPQPDTPLSSNTLHNNASLTNTPLKS